MAVDIQGVRINPGIIQFFDCDVGVSQKCLVSVKNISEKTRTIRFYAPQNKIFTLKVKEHDKNVASGLDHSAYVEYTPTDENTQSDRLIVTVDGEVVQVPVQGMPRQPVLEISDSVSFGVVVVANKVVTTNVKLYNRGSKPGEFRFEYNGDRPLSILPPHGSIPPKSVLPVRFDYITKDPGEFHEVVTAVLQGRPEPQKIAVFGDIVERQLELLNPATGEPMPCVQFGSAFYGTDKTEAAVLFNNAPEPVSFVSILEENAIGQESGPVNKSSNLSEAKECTNPLTSLVCMIPNQGTIAPYQKALVCFRFSPRWYKSKRSFHTTEDSPPKQEFALFMYIQLVGTQTDSASPDSHRTQLEVALTGTALPIMLHVSPKPELDFGPVQLNTPSDAAFTLANQTEDGLPVMFAFRKIAHFNASPERGQIEPGRELPVSVTFCPRQFGDFDVQLEICILGEVADDRRDPLTRKLDVIHSVFMRLSGSCRVFVTQPPGRFNPGINPLVANEVGLCAETKFNELHDRPVRPPLAALVAHTEARLHRHAASLSADAAVAIGNSRIAFPNDRAASIRPSERHVDYCTLFTRMKRHSFVDPDYAYEDDEVEKVRRHKQGYADSQRRRTENLIVSQRDRKLKKYENVRDMGMIPAMGMRPVKLGVEDLRPDTPPNAKFTYYHPVRAAPEPPNKLYQLLSTKEIQDVKETAANQTAKDGLSAVPMSQKEKEECRMLLRPQELHQVVITPGTIDFGVVCLRSVVTRELTVLNNLDTSIHLVVEIDCRELRHSSPLSQVVPPKSKALVPLIFESALQGRFQRNVSYVINGNYRNHVIALAEVVPVQLELSTRVLEVVPCEGQPAEAGIRGVITLYNRLNHPAEFSWEPVLKERQHTAFSIRPRAGVVEAFKDIDCEVVFRPSFNAPDEGYFRLHVEGGNDLNLKCIAKFGPTNVQFVNRRVMFGSVPLNMTTVKKAVLVNNSQNHAYFHVINSKPWPGMELEPLSGVVPVGGQKEIRISFTPSAVSKFDCGTRVAIRGWRDLELRMGGTILSPCVDIPLKEFNFDGVYVGASKSISFELVNRTQTDSRLEFDLKRYPDFSLDFGGRGSPEDLANPGMHTVTLKPEETLKAVLTFRPREVASYSFLMPVVINNTRAPSPAATPIPPSPAPTIKDGVSMSRIDSATSSGSGRVGWTPHVPVVQTPRKLVKGIALRPVLRLSKRDFAFQLAPEALSDDAQSPSTPPQHQPKSHGRVQILTLENTGDAAISWAVDLPDRQRALRDAYFDLTPVEGTEAAPVETRTEAGRRLSGRLNPGATVTLAVQFSPKRPGQFKARLPVVINEDWQFPYDHLSLRGELTWPSITFVPPTLNLTPCPLHTPVSVQFSVLAANYAAACRLDFTLPQVEADDGSPIEPLSLEYLDGRGPDILPAARDPDSNGSDASSAQLVELRCRLTFQASTPVSLSKEILFRDSFGNQARLPISATADNCLLTLYPFVLKHREDFHIVTEQGKLLEGRRAALQLPATETGEPQMVACRAEDLPGLAAASSRPSTTATSSNFEDSSTSYEETLSESAASNTPREGAVNNPASSSKATGQSAPRLPGMVGKTGKTRWPEHPLTESSSEALVDENYHLEREGLFYRDMLSIVQRWFTNYGWPGGQFPVTVPNSMRSGLSRKQQSDEQDDGRRKKTNAAAANKDDKGGAKSGAALDSGGGKSEVKTLYDMITHLCGRPAPGIPISAALPSQAAERVKQIYWQHATLLTFLRSQGGCLASVRPEHLMEPKDYRCWKALQGKTSTAGDAGADATGGSSPDDDGVEPSPGRLVRDVEEAGRDEELFECVSKRAWTDVLLQILKTLVLYKVTPRSFKNLRQPDPHMQLPNISLSPLASNVYTVNERILLAWLNHFYDNYRTRIWSDGDKGGVPPARWVINFDHDLLDGLVLAAVLGAHCPYLVDSHLRGMYTAPSTPEQCLHNSLRVVNAMRFVGVDFDVQALDLTAPNPILLMLLCVHLYQTLPQYIIKASVDFSGGLHQTCSRQVTLLNPVAKTLAYRAVLAGKDAADFSLPKGDLVSLPPKGRVPVSVEFRSRFLRPAEAVLLLIGRPSGPHQGTTQVFRLVTQVNGIQPISTVQVASHCYELKPVRLSVVNPFDSEAVFSVSLVEGGPDQLLFSNAERRQQQQQQPEKQVEKKKTKQGPPPPKSVDTKGPQSRSEPPVSMKSFFCHVPVIRLAARGSAEIDMNFLPFQVDRKQCLVVLRNPIVGEFVYSVDAVADLPVPTRIPMEDATAAVAASAPPSKTVRISSAVAASRGQSSIVHDHSVVYWRTEANKEVKEVLKIPLSNEYKEKALLQAAQQHLSAKEVQRRRVTGTLESGTLVEKAMEMLSAAGVNGKKPEKSSSTIEKRKFQFSKETIDFQVELDSPHFKAPSVISIPHPKSTDNSLKKDPSVTTFDLPLEFRPKRPGVYPVTIILKANDDVRLFRVECIVIPEGFSAELQFESPVNQAILQNIPVINQTKDDWRLKAEMHGVNFHGPDYLLAKAYKTTSYPLTFRPTHEGETSGRLLLTNLDDGTEHCYTLGGIGRKPLALDHLLFDCQVGETITRVVLVPNNSKRKLLYQVESNLSFVGGKKEVTVLPGRQVEYTAIIAPNKRGKFDGVIAFVADKDRLVDYDSDGEVMPPIDDNPSTEHRVWYSMELNVAPGEPMGRLEVTCPCYRTCEVEFAVRNPLPDREIQLDAEIHGESLRGGKILRLAPAEEATYRLSFSPALVEDTIGSVIFFNSDVGEFWYELNLHATPPPLTVLEPMECELGQHICQELTLENPSSAPIVLRPQLSNTNNFGLEITESEVRIPARGAVTLNLRFTPSDLGFAEHACRITFHSDELKEWIFEVNGSGLMPSAQNPVAITAPAGSNSTLIIPFHNPLDVPVICDILLTDSGKSIMEGIKELEDSPFCLLLKHSRKIRLEPKARLDIPISFAPENMQQHEAVCVVIMRRRDGKGWHYCPDEPKALPRSDSGGIAEIRWRFRVVGVPESKADRPEVPAPLVTCPARTVAEDRLEVWLAGVAPTPGAPQALIRARTRTPAGGPPSLPAGVEEAVEVPEPFTYGLVSLDDSLAGLLAQSVKLELLRQVRDSRTGMVVLTFALRLQPYKTFRVKTHLVIKSNAGGFWRYPLTVESTDPEPDDVITIHAAGLDKPNKVMFRLTSKELHSVKFHAYFEDSHDSGDFRVEPQTGELPPHGTDGLPFTVTFLPSYYGKPKRVRLIIHTDDMEWTYIIVGEIPEYQPPAGRSLPPVSGPHPNPIVRSGRVKNYIRDNLRLQHTAVSSPIKLAPLMCKKEQLPLF